MPPKMKTYLEIQSHEVDVEYFRTLGYYWPKGEYKKTDDETHEWFVVTENYPVCILGFGIPGNQEIIEVERIWHLADRYTEEE